MQKRYILFTIILILQSVFVYSQTPGVNAPSRSIGIGIWQVTPPNTYQSTRGIFHIDTLNEKFWLHKGNGVYNEMFKTLTESEVDSFVSNNGYITSYTETDPDFNSHLASQITTSDTTYWGTDTNTQLDESQVDAFVSNNGYLTSETDPTFTGHLANDITTTDTTYWGLNYTAWRNTSDAKTDNIADDVGRTGKVGVGYTSSADLKYTFNVNGKMRLNNTGNSVLIGDFLTGSDPSQSVIIGYQASQNRAFANNVLIGYKAGQNSDASNSVFIGRETGSNSGATATMIGIGAFALSNSNSFTQQSTAIGYTAGRYMNGRRNIVMGHECGVNLVGSGTILLGENTGNTLTGENNTGIGTKSLFNFVGSNNVGIGSNSISVGDGSDNIGIGYRALEESEGSGNVAIGKIALFNNKNDYNTSIGFESQKYVNSNSTENTSIGKDALKNINGSQNTAIGVRAFENTIASATSQNFAPGDVGVGTFDITVTAHPFGATGTHFVGIVTSTGTAPDPWTSGTQRQFEVIDSNTVRYVSNSGQFNDAGTGTHTLTASEIINNSTAIGYNASIDASNQIQLGNTSVTQVRTSGDILINDNSKGLILISPDGTKYRLTVDNAGVLSTVLVP